MTTLPDPLDDVTVTESDHGAVTATLPSTTSSVALARRIATTRWLDLDPTVLDDVELIVAELVSNAVRHGRPDIEFRLRRAPYALDIAVLDHGPGHPRIARDPLDSELTSGRGLFLVDRLAHAWGVDALESAPGKTVWATVHHG